MRHAQIDGLRVILDLDGAAYRVLDDVASAMWTVLVGERSRSDALAELSAAYDVPPAVLERDLEQFAARCAAEGLLVEEPPSAVQRDAGSELLRGVQSRAVPMRAVRSRIVRWHWLAALRSLVATNRGLARKGLRHAYERAAAVPLGAPRVALPRAVGAFLAAEGVYVSSRGPDDCLGRSLALFAYLRAAGFAAEHVIGVRRIPFKAHAWVEHEGEVVLDRRVDEYVPLARLRGAA